MNVNANYKALIEGRMSKAEFLRQARQGLPQYITNLTSFDDAIKVLRHKSLLSEELVYQNKADQFPLESIQRGIRYELEAMNLLDINTPSKEEYRKAREKAIDNLCKDSLYYINKIAGNTKKQAEENQEKADTDDKLKEVKPGKKNLSEGRYVNEASTDDKTLLNKKFLDFYIKYKDGNYQVKDKETGELKPGKQLAPETAAQKACMVVRKAYNSPRFRPDRNTIASCASGRGKLQYQGEKNGVPSFNYAWSISENENLDEYRKPTDFNDPIFVQMYQHYLKKYKAEKRPNAEKEARSRAISSYQKYKEKQTVQESATLSKKKIEEMVLKESIINLIGKVLGEGMITEAATANLAQLSDENASVSELPSIINSLENIVTEIESFWLKEQQKIQGIFDSLGNIKNEDGLPVGYKFAQPIMKSLSEDLAPVLSKITLESINLPEAPAPDQTPVNDPTVEPEVPEKETVFSPADKDTPLQESKSPKRRYTK